MSTLYGFIVCLTLRETYEFSGLLKEYKPYDVWKVTPVCLKWYTVFVVKNYLVVLVPCFLIELRLVAWNILLNTLTITMWVNTYPFLWMYVRLAKPLITLSQTFFTSCSQDYPISTLNYACLLATVTNVLPSMFATSESDLVYPDSSVIYHAARFMPSLHRGRAYSHVSFVG